MSQLPDARQLFQAAEAAAVAGDLASADDLLRTVARIQEDQLGPAHPDLASTLNNLAIVAEKTGRPDDAEAFYRRAAAIASAALPAALMFLSSFDRSYSFNVRACFICHGCDSLSYATADSVFTAGILASIHEVISAITMGIKTGNNDDNGTRISFRTPRPDKDIDSSCACDCFFFGTFGYHSISTRKNRQIGRLGLIGPILFSTQRFHPAGTPADPH